MSKNKTLGAQDLTRLALVAALYAALTIALSWLSFGQIQFRIAEILTLLCFYRKDYSIALILGCFIANCFSPMALMDMAFGTLATAIAVIPMFYMKNIWIASLLPVISNAIVISIELLVAYNEPVWLSILTVGAGELVVITIVGCPLFRFVLQKNKIFMQAIGSRKSINK